jgi:hypothetical protein
MAWRDACDGITAPDCRVLSSPSQVRAADGQAALEQQRAERGAWCSAVEGTTPGAYASLTPGRADGCPIIERSAATIANGGRRCPAAHGAWRGLGAGQQAGPSAGRDRGVRRPTRTTSGHRARVRPPWLRERSIADPVWARARVARVEKPEAPRTAEGCRGRAREQCALRATAVHPSGHARLWERAFDLGAGRPGPARWQRSEGRCRTPPGLRLPSAGRRGARPLSGWGSGANQGQPRTLSRGSTVQVSVPAPPRTLSSPTLSWAFKESFPSPAMRWSAPVPLTRVSSPMLP